MSLATLNGLTVKSGTITIPRVGAGRMVLDIETETRPTGRALLSVGARTIACTIDERRSGSFVDEHFVTATFGGGGWHRSVKRKHYKNDFGVQSKTVLDDVARECGEVMQVDASVPVGGDFVRVQGPAVDALTVLAPAWWVDFAGVTHATPRAASAPSGFELLTFDVLAREAVIATDDELGIEPGALITDVRVGTVTVDEVRIMLDPKGSRVIVSTAGFANRITDLIRAIARNPREALAGLHRYRVISSSEKVCELELVTKREGIPNLAATRMWPGVAGSSFEPTAGSTVLVAFVDLDPTQPIVTHFEGAGLDTYVPVSVSIEATTAVSLGTNAARVVCGQALPGTPLEADGRFVRYGDLVAVGASTGAMTFVSGDLGTAGT